MSIWTILICAFGISFWVQNKISPYLEGKNSLLDALLTCTFCLGFHCGWVSYVGMVVSCGTSLLWYQYIIQAIIYGFASGVFCYFFDELSLLIENKK